MRMIPLMVAAIVVGVLGGAGTAWADLAPRDACTSPGQPCQAAGPNFDQAGTCQATTCTKGLPDGNGGITTTTYACNLCVGGGNGGTTGAGGTAATGGSGDAAGGAGGAPAGTGGQTPIVDPKPTPAKSSGCAVGGGASLDVTALLLLALSFVRRRPNG